MHVIKNHTADNVWLEALKFMERCPIVSPRRMPTVEPRQPVALVVENPEYGLICNPYRRLNYAFALVEILWILEGRSDLRMLKPYNKSMAKFSDDGISMAGAYGPQVSPQLNYILETLRKDRDSRQAVLTIWKPNPKPSKDIPCTVMMHFMIRDFRLNLNVYMRSNDLWLGTPYDINTFTTIQKVVASSLGMKLGTYTHMAGSLHMYVPDIPKITWAIKYPSKDPVKLPLPMMKDFRDLAIVEKYLRKEDESTDYFEHMTPYVTIHAQLLRAYWGLKRKNPVDFPEPYKSLREEAREVYNYFKNSQDDERLELNDPDSRHGGA